jgi:predicted Rossmann-fold nucleotide-binding protein
MDEMFEVLTLSQTRKLDRAIPIVLYGSDYWREIVDFDALVRHGVIDAADLGLFTFADEPAGALALLQEKLPARTPATTPAFAKTRVQVDPAE